jgi:hypothetical protein
MPHVLRLFGLSWFWVVACVAVDTSADTLANSLTLDAEANPSADRRLFGWHDVDGYLFGAFGNDIGWETGAMGYGALVMGWNPRWAGFSARLAGALVHQGSALPDDGSAHRRVNYFGYGLEEAWLLYPTELYSWKASLQAGLFRWRSHADAALAGEYLTRWMPYSWDRGESRVTWETLDSLTTAFQGLRFILSSPGARFRQEALAILDAGDQKTELSLLWSTTVAPLPGLEAGIAVAWDRITEEAVSRNTPRPVNRYSDSSNSPADTSHVVLIDTAGFSWYRIHNRRYSARITIDPVTLYNGISRPDRGGRFFLEAASMGWETLPAYSEVWHRQLHFNFGLYFPTFGIFDRLRIQAELWPKYHVAKSLIEIYEQTIPAPGQIGTPSDTTSTFVPYPTAPTHHWYWHLYLSRSLLPWLDFQAKVIRGNRLRQTTSGFELQPRWIRTETQSWTAFEVRLAARL